LHLAAHWGDVDQINRLIAPSADVDIRDQSQRTPVQVAALASHDDTLREFAKGGRK
jgi:hypothetical protein